MPRRPLFIHFVTHGCRDRLLISSGPTRRQVVSAADSRRLPRARSFLVRALLQTGAAVGCGG